MCRLYSSGGKLSEGAVMAADGSLSLERISGAMHAMFDMLSKPETLPEFNSLQVNPGQHDCLCGHASYHAMKHTLGIRH